MIFPPQSYVAISGDLHQKLILIKRGIFIEVDILGNHMLRGPGDLINVVSALTKYQLSTIVSLTHVQCYVFDKQFYTDLQKKCTIFDIQRKFPSYRYANERILFNIFSFGELDEQRAKTQLANLEGLYTFNITTRHPCRHKSFLREVLMLKHPLEPFGKAYLLWNCFMIVLLSMSAVLGLQNCLQFRITHSCQIFNCLMDCILLFDCYLRIQTPFFNSSGLYITDFSLISKRWLKNYALNDFLLLFPHDFIVYVPWRLGIIDDNIGRTIICMGWQTYTLLIQNRQSFLFVPLWAVSNTKCLESDF